MKISGKGPLDGVSAPQRLRRTADSGAAAPEPAPPVRTVTDVATFLGIPEAELTPSVREGLAKLIEEVARLRDEVESKERRIAYLEQLADEDPLTPLLNRRAFVRELSRTMAFNERYGGRSSVLYFDVNGMKQINDTHGHSAGDSALTHVAEVLLHNVRNSDIVGRLGGDEFAVVLAQADEAAAAKKGAELAALINRTPFAWEGQTLTVAVAVGAFAFDGSGEPNDILSRADQAMYEHKRSRTD
jgi:diguanylate cyclase (GGDEF)-like protein